MWYVYQKVSYFLVQCNEKCGDISVVCVAKYAVVIQPATIKIVLCLVGLYLSFINYTAMK